MGLGGFEILLGGFEILLDGFAGGFGGFGWFRVIAPFSIDCCVHHFSCKLFATNNKTKFSLNSYVFCQFLKINRLIC